MQLKPLKIPKMPHCRICGKETGRRVCANCQYFLDNGADEETIRKMLSDDETKNVWKANEKRANDLAQAYYDSTLDMFDKDVIKKDSKENFGFNMFNIGIKLGLDIIMPLLDKEDQEKVVEKINSMIKRSEKRMENGK